MIRTYLLFVMGFLLVSIFHNFLFNDPRLRDYSEYPDEGILDNFLEYTVPTDIFIKAETVTGCPAEILRGIAGTESHFSMIAVGDRGLSHGMFQLHSRWHDSRVQKYGEFDPFDPADAAIIAGYIIQENLRVFNGDLRLAIAAYKQGVTGVVKNGAIDWYVDSVIFWRSDPKKMLAFSVFEGITELGKDGYINIGTQATYQPQIYDTVALQVSRRGSSGIPY